MTQKTEQLTPQEMAELEAQLTELQERMTEVVADIAVARGFGDLSENFEYHAAKEEQGQLYARISVLEERIRSAQVVSEKGRAGVVAAGTRVTIEDERGETLQVQISNLAGESGRASVDSPLGQALLGHRTGDVVTVQAPRGPWQATIKKVERVKS